MTEDQAVPFFDRENFNLRIFWREVVETQRGRVGEEEKI